MYAYVHFRVCVFVHIYAYLCNCMGIVCTCVKGERERGWRKRERGGEMKREGKEVIFNVRV